MAAVDHAAWRIAALACVATVVRIGIRDAQTQVEAAVRIAAADRVGAFRRAFVALALLVPERPVAEPERVTPIASSPR